MRDPNHAVDQIAKRLDAQFISAASKEDAREKKAQEGADALRAAAEKRKKKRSSMSGAQHFTIGTTPPATPPLAQTTPTPSVAGARDDDDPTGAFADSFSTGWGTSPTQIVTDADDPQRRQGPRPEAPGFDQTPSPPPDWKPSPAWAAWAEEKDATKEKHLQAVLNAAHIAAMPHSAEPEPEGSLFGSQSPSDARNKVGPLHPEAPEHRTKTTRPWAIGGDTPQPPRTKLHKVHT